MKYLELMEKEIIKANKPLTIREALIMAEEDGTINELNHVGKTPQNTISALIHKDIAKGDLSRFIQVSALPAKFDIKRG